MYDKELSKEILQQIHHAAEAIYEICKNKIPTLKNIIKIILKSIE